MTASAARNVAKTGDTEYATLDAAVAAAQDGDTVTLLASTSIDENVIIQKRYYVESCRPNLACKCKPAGRRAVEYH